MRLRILLFCFISVSFVLQGQQYFPVKLNKKWGLIDADGHMVQQPVYDAIGDFKAFGYAVMQRSGRVGLLNKDGKEIVPPNYDDLKVLDSTLIAVMDYGDWMVINLQGKVVLNKGYSKVEVWKDGFLGFRKGNKWGVIKRSGKQILPPDYDEVYQEAGNFFLTRKGEQLGLTAASGKEILPNIANEIKIFNDSLFFFNQGHSWGAVDEKGREVIPPRYDSYRRLSDNFIRLIDNNRLYLYSIPCSKIITQGEYDEYYSFSKKYVIVKSKRRLGLLDWCGNQVLAPKYSEIQAYVGNLFRVNQAGKWGVVDNHDKLVIQLEYDYIAPLRGTVCLVKKEGKFGIVNFKGEEVVDPLYDRIEIADDQAKAYQKKVGGSGEEELTLLSFDGQGNLEGNSNFTKHYTVKIGGKKPSGEVPSGFEDNDYQLAKFEWFYSPAVDRWGLRRLSDGGVQIEPTFHYVQVERALNFTLVGIEKYTKYEFERTTYRFDMIYGLVNNDVGLLVTEVDFWDVSFEDFKAGLPLARCIFSNGKYGLVDRIGRIVRKDMAYIGEFSGGAARMSISGRLSGSIKQDHSLGKLTNHLRDIQATNYLVDYTQYDQLFQQEAALICEGCEWGYLDTIGQVIVPPSYAFAYDMVNDVGIVECDGKWGMINRKAEVLIPCTYDGVEFLENTGNRIVRVYVQEPKYGLIDTLGQLTVGAIYEEIGSFSEGRLAVMRNGMWGFVNPEGLEVIPCRFKEVSNFSEGVAAAKLGRHWGFIDKQGHIEIDFKYRRAGNFKDGLAWVSDDKGVGYINKADQFMIRPQFGKAYDFDRGVARVVNNGEFGLIDRTGKYIQRPKYSDIQEFDRYGLAIVRYGKERIRYGLINLKGESVTNLDFRQIEPFQEGLAAVKYRNGFGFINVRGELVIPDIYSKVSGFRDGLASVTLNGNCGYITTKGETAVDFDFSKCLDFEEGKAVVYKGIRNAGLIDQQGKFIMEPGVDRLLKFQEGRGLVRDEKYRFYYITEQSDLYNGYYQRASEFKHGVAVVKIDGKWGIINQKGIEIIPPKYDKIESFQDGYAKVRIEGFTGLTNLKGELIANPDYEFISYAGEGLFRVEKGDKIGYFDSRGHWVWDLTK